METAFIFSKIRISSQPGFHWNKVENINGKKKPHYFNVNIYVEQPESCLKDSCENVQIVGKKEVAEWNRRKVPFQKFLVLISLHMLASLKPVWKEETAFFIAKNLKWKCSGTVRNGSKGGEDSLFSSKQLNTIYHIVLDEWHACITTLGLSLSPGIENFACTETDWWPSADGVSLAPLWSVPEELSPEEEDVVGVAETIAEHQADESTSC